MTKCHKCNTVNKSENLFCTKCYQYLYRASGTSGEQTTSGPSRPVEEMPDASANGRFTAHRIQLNDFIESQLTQNGHRIEPRPKTEALPQEQPQDDAMQMPEMAPVAFPPHLRLILVGLTIVTAGILLFLGLRSYLSPTQDSPSTLFAKAELLYRQQDYLAARQHYLQFIADYPGNKLSAVISGKLDAINTMLVADQVEEQMAEQQGELLTLAASAVVEQRFLQPDDDNAFLYIRKILALDPANQTALKLQQEMEDHIEKQARQAKRRRNFREAIQHYSSLLTVSPQHPRAQRELVDLLDQDNEPAESENLRYDSPAAQKYSSGPFAQSTESRSSQDLAARASDLAAPDASPVVADTQLIVPLKMSAWPRGGILSKTAQNISKTPEPILETFLDGGRRQYIRRTKPEYPKRYNETSIEGKVIMEVIVDEFGYIAQHKVLSTTGPAFTEACIAALESYQYEPGTSRNKPVRFRIVERFLFKLKE